MAMWILSFVLMAIEAWGCVYFYDIFIERKRTGRLDKYRHIILYFGIIAVALLGDYLGSMGVKALLAVLAHMAFCAAFYKADWKQCIFFSVLNYALLLLADIFLMLAGSILAGKDGRYAPVKALWALPAKLVWVLLLFLLRRIWQGKNSYNRLSRRQWQKFSAVPLFTVAAILSIYFGYSSEKRVQVVYLFLAAGLVMINFLVMILMQDILVQGELLRESALTDQKKESQLAHYRDMQAVYERQGQKLHDYKNQIRTMQVLLKEGDAQAAVLLAERLTESISVEMAAVNTNHSIVDAVLNQKFHAAKERGISMIFKVGDMAGLKLDGEETVILLSNLLDNAIHECVRVAAAGRKAVINIKLVQEGGRLIFSVRNPVVEKVRTADGAVLDAEGRRHGTGLANVKAVADKYGGDLALSCDEEKFQAVVIL